MLVTSFVNIFSHSVGCLFVLLTVSFVVQKLLIMSHLWYIYTMEYYLAIKKNKIMAFAATWMDLEIIVPLSEVRDRKSVV